MSKTSTIAKAIAIPDLSLPLVAMRHLVGIRHQPSARAFCEPNVFMAQIAGGQCGRAIEQAKSADADFGAISQGAKRLVVGSFSCKVMDQTPTLTFEE